MDNVLNAALVQGIGYKVYDGEKGDRKLLKEYYISSKGEIKVRTAPR